MNNSTLEINEVIQSEETTAERPQGKSGDNFSSQAESLIDDGVLPTARRNRNRFVWLGLIGVAVLGAIGLTVFHFSRRTVPPIKTESPPAAETSAVIMLSSGQS